MSFLDNLAMRRTYKGLQPFMRGDERLIEYDVADVDPVASRIPVVLSSRAVYLMGQTTIRIPYQNIIDVQAEGSHMIALFTASGNSFVIRIRGRPKGDLYETIRHHVDRVVKHRQDVEVIGGEVRAICRPTDEDGKLKWLFLHDMEQAEFEKEDVRRALTEALSPAIERLGVKLPFEKG